MLIWSAATDVGLVRDRNEDAYDVFELPAPAAGHVFVVADGMGGQRAGDVASRLAVRFLREHLLSWAARSAGRPSAEAAGDALSSAVRYAHDGLLRHTSLHPELYGMGTTLTAVRVENGAFQYAHVGDSRLYLLRGDSLVQISRDHALVADLLRSGQITEQQAWDHPQRHVLTQALGQEGELEVDVGGGELQAGDVLLLCTDGLTSVLRDEELRITLRQSPAAELAERLVALANRRGGPDNITVIAIRSRAAYESGHVVQGGSGA